MIALGCLLLPFSGQFKICGAATPAQCFTPFHNFFKCIDISDTALCFYSVSHCSHNGFS